MPTADNMPDFDSMSPEEIMAWMETLAKRQGATEGLTTAANMEIAEIDPSTVVIDEPGYVPYGQESKKTSEQKAVTPPPAAPERPAAAPPPTPLRQPAPAAQEPPRQPTAPERQSAPPPPTPLRQPAPAAQQPPAQQPPRQPAPAAQQPPPEPQRAPSDENAMAWLESLAADQDDSLFNLDLSGLSSTPAAADTAADPMAWLENLASNQGGFSEPAPLPSASAPPADPFASGVDPIAWLESLAKRQGANTDELTTSADVSLPQSSQAEPPELDLSILGAELEPQQPELANPVSFLDSLASDYTEESIPTTTPAPQPPAEESIDSITEAIASGTVSREQMQQWLEHQTDLYVQEAEQPVEEIDPDAPPLPAELPSWLLDQFGPPPVAEKPPQPEAPQPSRSLEELFPTPQAAPLPDWLREDTGGESIDLQSIFADTAPEEVEVEKEIIEAPVAAAQPPAVTEPGDTWAEALDEEYEQGTPDITTVPDWYEHNVNDPARRAAVEQLETGELIDPDTALPVESELAAGQQQPVPDWLAETTPATPPFGTSYAPEVPDWIREAEAAVSLDQIPDWLNETLEEPHIEEFIPAYTPPPAPEPVRPAADVRSPVPERQAPTPTRTVTAGGSLEAARRLGQNGDIPGALAEYESLIRANVELETVVEDLSKIVSANRSNAAAYRVLGDGLMRQGKLQAALETYRQALNQL